MWTFVNNLEKQIQRLEPYIVNTRNVFMKLAKDFILRLREKIMREASPKKIEKVFEIPELVKGINDSHVVINNEINSFVN